MILLIICLGFWILAWINKWLETPEERQVAEQRCIESTKKLNLWLEQCREREIIQQLKQQEIVEEYRQKYPDSFSK